MALQDSGMNKKVLTALIFISILLLVLSFCEFGKGPSGPFSIFRGSLNSETSQESAHLTKASWPPVESSAKAAAPGFLPTRTESPEKFQAFKNALLDMGSCLNMQIGTPDPESEINFDYFNSLISSDLGEIVEENEEWTLTDLRTPDGEIRRIFVENIPQDETKIQHNLRYFRVRADGELEEIPRTEEQATLPAETLMINLEKDGEVLARSRARRIFYQNGDGLLLVERNGKIYSLQLPHDEKIFKCLGADDPQTMKCSCE